MYNHSLEERQYIEPGNTPIKKRTSSQSQVINIKEIKVGRCQVKFIKIILMIATTPNEIEQKQLPLICDKIYSNSSLLARLLLCDCNYTILLLSLFVLITLKLRGEACQTDRSILIFVLVTVETIWLVRSIKLV